MHGYIVKNQNCRQASNDAGSLTFGVGKVSDPNGTKFSQTAIWISEIRP
jgi:hypothetical protein